MILRTLNRSTLDCSSFDSTVHSIETLLNLPAHRILDVIASFDCNAHSRSHPEDHQNLHELLLERLAEHGATCVDPSGIYWFHGTQALNPETLKEGIRSLDQQIEVIWQELSVLAHGYISEHAWQEFRTAVETGDPYNSSRRFRDRLANDPNRGPRAVLIRDALFYPDRFSGWNYLAAPETIHDICASFQVHFGQDLLSEFRRHSRACIVKFRDDRVQQRALGIALSYLWCWHHEGNCTKCDTCYESGGNSIDAYSIEQIEEVADQDVPE